MTVSPPPRIHFGRIGGIQPLKPIKGVVDCVSQKYLRFFLNENGMNGMSESFGSPSCAGVPVVLYGIVVRM